MRSNESSGGGEKTHALVELPRKGVQSGAPRYALLPGVPIARYGVCWTKRLLAKLTWHRACDGVAVQYTTRDGEHDYEGENARMLGHVVLASRPPELARYVYVPTTVCEGVNSPST